MMTDKAIPKSVGIWIRVSTEDQAQGDSPEHHEKRARYYAESKEWKVLEVYHLEAVSGKSVMQHPEAQRMLKDIKSGHITGLIFSKLARLARNVRERLAAWREAAGMSGVQLAKQLEIGATNLIRWERGSCQPGNEVIVKIRMWLNRSQPK